MSSSAKILPALDFDKHQPLGSGVFHTASFAHVLHTIDDDPVLAAVMM